MGVEAKRRGEPGLAPAGAAEAKLLLLSELDVSEERDAGWDTESLREE